MKKHLFISLLFLPIVFLLVSSSGYIISAKEPNGLILKTSSDTRIAHNKLSDFAVYFINTTDDTLIIYAVPGLWLTHNDTAYMNGLYHVIYTNDGKVVEDASDFLIFSQPLLDFCDEDSSEFITKYIVDTNNSTFTKEKIRINSTSNIPDNVIYSEPSVLEEEPRIENYHDDLDNNWYSRMCYANEHFAKYKKLIPPHDSLTFKNMFLYSAKHMGKGEYTVVFYYYISGYMKKVIREDIYDKNKKVPMGLYKAKKKIIVE